MKKRTVFVLIAALLAVAGLSAQSGPMMGPGGAPGAAPVGQPQATVKVEGKLMLLSGMVALQTGGKTYYVHMPQMLYGFIDGLKEGATVKLEGYEEAVPLAQNSYFLLVTKLTINGRDYDLSQFAQRMMGGRAGRGMGQGGRGQGMGQGRP